MESRTSELPGYVRDVVVSERDSRVLLVDLGSDGTVSWNIVDSRRPQWGSGETDPAGGFILWIELPGGLDSTALFEACLAERIAQWRAAPGAAEPVRAKPAEVQLQAALA